MVSLNAIGGLTYRYPYGGEARHEFFLVPFVIVALFSLIEVVRRGAPRRFAGRHAWTALAVFGVPASVASWTSSFRIEPDAPFQPQMTRFRSLILSPRAVLLDQYSFINFFSHYHDWQWRAGSDWPGEAVRQGWLVTKGDTIIAVCRDTQWSLDMTSAHLRQCDRVWTAHGRRPRRDLSHALARGAVLNRRVRCRPRRVGPLDADRDGAERQRRDCRFRGRSGGVQRCTGAPPAPRDLHVVSNSERVVVLEWSSVGGTRTSYVIEAELAPGLSDALNAPVGRTTTYTARGVNPATYYVRAKAKTLCGVSPPSTEIRVAVPSSPSLSYTCVIVLGWFDRPPRFSISTVMRS